MFLAKHAKIVEKTEVGRYFLDSLASWRLGEEML